MQAYKNKISKFPVGRSWINLRIHSVFISTQDWKFKVKINSSGPSRIKNAIVFAGLTLVGPSRWARNEFQEERQRVYNDGEVKRYAKRAPKDKKRGKESRRCWSRQKLIW